MASFAAKTKSAENKAGQSSIAEHKSDNSPPALLKPGVPQFSFLVQRKAACAADGPSCPACEDKEPVAVSRKAQVVAAGEAPASVGSVIHSPGQPLAASTRAFFEPRFGQDLSHVRVHTDREAQQSARDVNALAYTVGSHVVFDAGRYAPGTPDGQRLLAHELTNVVQQAGPDTRGATQVQRTVTSTNCLGNTNSAPADPTATLTALEEHAGGVRKQRPFWRLSDPPLQQWTSM